QTLQLRITLPLTQTPPLPAELLPAYLSLQTSPEFAPRSATAQSDAPARCFAVRAKGWSAPPSTLRDNPDRSHPKASSNREPQGRCGLPLMLRASTANRSAARSPNKPICE